MRLPLSTEDTLHTIDDEGSIFVSNGSFKLPMSGVVLEHVHHVVDRNERIVHRHNLMIQCKAII